MTSSLLTHGARSRGATALFMPAVLVALSGVAPSPLRAQATAADSSAIASLPLRELPVTSPGHAFVFLITGDGGYAAGDRGIAETFVRRGLPVVVLNSRDYLRHQKTTPDTAAADAATIMAHYMATWHRDSVVFVGYSRGADMAPFIVTRLPETLRGHLALVAMVGLADHASFEFHWSDIVKDTRRPTDLPVQPELMKNKGVRMLCLYGAQEKDSLCPELPPSLITVDQHGGKHSLSKEDGVAVAERVLRELEAAPSR